LGVDLQTLLGLHQKQGQPARALKKVWPPTDGFACDN
jgi:hypothetical protein